MNDLDLRSPADDSLPNDQPAPLPTGPLPSGTLPKESRRTVLVEIVALVLVFFIYAGDPPPAVNEAHYLVKAKHFWDPSFCANDLLVTSGKAHTAFYVSLGWLTRWLTLDATAWIGRTIGWAMLAIGLQRCCRSLRLPAFASLGVAVLWIAGVEYGNLAGEWVVGGIEAKVPAYGLVLVGVSEVLRRRWSRAWVWYGAASAFHVLTGGWAVIASMIAFAATERWFVEPDSEQHVDRAPFFSAGLFAGGLLALIGLIPAVLLTLSVPPEQSVAAARIYTYVRLTHHLLPGEFPLHWYLRHGVLVGGLLAVALRGNSNARQRRLNWIGLGTLCIAAAGLIVGMLPAYAPDLAAKLLRYYWFRLSDATIPLVLAFWCVTTLRSTRWKRPETEIRHRLAAWSAVSLSIAGVLLFGWSSFERLSMGTPPSTSHRLLRLHPDAARDQQWRSHQDWVAVCHWIRTATPRDEVFLTPRHQQSFKWYAHRAEVVNWKDVPQDAGSLLQWQRRFDDVFPKRLGTVAFNSMRVPISYSKLMEYKQRYGVRFMVVDNRVATRQLPLVRLYPVGDQVNETYSVYELPYE